MQSPTFNALPAIHCPDWAPKPVRSEYEALCTSQQAIETSRSEVLEALQKARSQDLAVYTPVVYNGHPMMQAELLHRRAVVAYLKNLMAAASVYADKCRLESEQARDEVKKRLLKAGYIEPGDTPGRGCYTPEFLMRHELVRCAAEKCDSARAFDMGDHIRENLQQITALESKLSRLREAVLTV